MLCHLMRLGHVHTLEEIWALLNRGPEQFWDLMHCLFHLQPWGAAPCPGQPLEGCCLQKPIETIGWLLGREVPAFPAGLLPPYGIVRPEVLSLLREGIGQGWAAKKPVLVSGPRTSGMTTLFRHAVACARIAVWERQTGRRAALTHCQRWRGSEEPFFAQALYWRDQPDWDNEVWMKRLLDPNEPGGSGLGAISAEVLDDLPILLLLDDLQPGRPVQALQARLGSNTVVVAGRHGAFVTEEGLLLEIPVLREKEATALIRRYWKVEGLGEVQPLPQEVQRQMVALSGGNLGFVLELLHIARQISPEQMSGYLRSAQREPVQVQGKVPVAEARAAAFVRRLLQALAPQQQEALRKVARLPYFAGYGAWELGLLWEMDEGSAHVLLGELVRQGFGVPRPGGLQGDWGFSPVMYRWLRRAFGITKGEEEALLRLWQEQVRNAPGFHHVQRKLIQALERSEASANRMYMAYIDETLMPLQRMSMLKRLIYYLRHGEAYALTVWRSLPLGILTTGEYLLGEHLLPKAERAAHRIYFWTLLGALFVIFLHLAGWFPWENFVLESVEMVLLLWLLLLWAPWMVWLLYRPRIIHRRLGRLLRRVLKRWQQGGFEATG